MYDRGGVDDHHANSWFEGVRFMTTKQDRLNTHEEIVAELLQVLEPHVSDSDSIARIFGRAHLVTDLGMDSVAILQMILEAEKAFGITIAAHELDMEVLSGVDRLAEFIERKLHEAH
jgi:acyl carrier protein